MLELVCLWAQGNAVTLRTDSRGILKRQILLQKTSRHSELDVAPIELFIESCVHAKLAMQPHLAGTSPSPQSHILFVEPSWIQSGRRLNIHEAIGRDFA
ncbi:unnamed protein product [Leptosia nina]|uniref:Uncharacterized protein n=1 Tax=Leptosia nina TaxID=320188 RepID=A0AAV1JBW6_9NEOP